MHTCYNIFLDFSDIIIVTFRLLWIIYVIQFLSAIMEFRLCIFFYLDEEIWLIFQFFDVFLGFLGFCGCMVGFLVSLSLNQFLVGFVWEKVWLSNFFILIYISMSFSCTISSFTTASISLVSLFSHLFCHLHLSYYYRYFIFVFNFPQFSLMDFLMFFKCEIKQVSSKNQKLGVCGDSHPFFFSFHFNFCDSNDKVS